MRSIIFNIAVLAAFAVISTSCKKPETPEPTPPPQPTSATITILDELGNPSAGAYVALYETESDYNNDTNPVQGIKQADNSGKVTFSPLEPAMYWIRAANVDRNNSGGANHTAKPLNANTENLITVVLQKVQ